MASRACTMRDQDEILKGRKVGSRIRIFKMEVGGLWMVIAAVKRRGSDQRWDAEARQGQDEGICGSPLA